MIIFRVDANSMIGKIHMKRCVSVAKAIKIAGGKVLFVTREDSDTSLLENAFMEFRTISSMKLGSENSINQLKEIINEVDASVCVIDSYDVSDAAFKSLREICKVVLIEDFLYDVYDVDCIVNYNFYVEKLDYMSKYNNSVDLLLGTDYVPFSTEDASLLRRNPSTEINSILLYTGELDSHELAPGIVDSLLDCIDDNVRIRVMTSKNATTRDILYKMSNSSSQLIVEQDVASLSKLIKSCDVAVTVADPLCYDFISYSLPTCVYMSDYSQNMLLNSLTERKIMVFGGDYVNKRNRFFGDLVEGVKTLILPETRKDILDTIDNLNLKKGAKNLAQAIMKYE